MSEPDIREDARAEAEASIDKDAMAAADGLKPSSGVGEHYREMTEKGANAKGEGRVP